MMDKSEGEQTIPREDPIIPESGNIKDWKHVYFHSTRFDRLIPALYSGVWSVAFGSHHRVKQPIKPGGFSPVQEEVGWDWISVYDADHLNRDSDILPGGEDVTLVLRKLPSRSKPAIAERKLPGEHLVHWRISPRNIVALWVNGETVDKRIEEFFNDDVSQETFDNARIYFERLSRIDPSWRERMIQISKEEYEKAKARYPVGSIWVGERTKQTTNRALVAEWLKQEYQVDPTENTITDLLKKIEAKTGVKTYKVAIDESGAKKAILI